MRYCTNKGRENTTMCAGAAGTAWEVGKQHLSLFLSVEQLMLDSVRHGTRTRPPDQIRTLVLLRYHGGKTGLG